MEGIDMLGFFVFAFQSRRIIDDRSEMFLQPTMFFEDVSVQGMYLRL